MAVEVRSIESGQGITITTARGRVAIRTGPSGLLSGIGEGRLSADMSEPLLGAYDKVLERHPRAVMFFDGWEVTGADAQLVETAGAWVLRQRAPIVTHTLIRSKLLELSVSMLNLFTRRTSVELYTDRAKFVAAARRDWMGFTPLVLPPREE